ncbi:MAG TPA: PKD domain-containing protein, partial [Vicinamibacterales bacterium]|nr:PKD domain-containing protein [Vicinamibacterales bacterium]
TGATYDVTLIVTDQQGNKDVTRRRLTANTPPVASFTVSCNGPVCTFDGSGSADSDGTINRYDWSFGDGYGGYGASITHTYATGTYTASLSVTDSGGRESTPRQQTLTVTNALPVASFTITCSGLACDYDASASSDPDGTIFWHYWRFGDGSSVRAKVGRHTYVAAGSYTVTLTVADDADQTSTASQTVTVVVPPPPPPPPAMHVGDLDGTSATLQKSWTATVTIGLHAESHGPAEGVTVSGAWNDGSSGTCTIDSAGRCQLSRSGIPRTASTASFTVTSANHSLFVVKPAGNHDPDGDSNGTTITVKRR